MVTTGRPPAAAGAVRGRGQREAAPPAFGLHESLGLKAGKGGPDHGAAHAKLADQRVFARKLVAGLDVAVDDAVAKIGGEVRGQVPAHGFKITRRTPPARWSRRGPGH